MTVLTSEKSDALRYDVRLGRDEVVVGVSEEESG